jgi:short subunit dehydrogenase-like uncharacterized protein
MTVTVFGGYGTFGAQVVRALQGAGLGVRVVGRDPERAEVVADLNRPDDCARAIAGSTVAVNCAGPFSATSLALPEACLGAGIHSVDIADDRRYVARLQEMSARFAGRGLTAAVGCSSLPGISGALASLLSSRVPRAVRALVVLFIGNANPKGLAAVTSARQQLSQGLRGRERVELPPPFGRRTVYDWESPERDLFPSLLGVREVRVKVGFESRLGTAAFAVLARHPLALDKLLPVARLFSHFGHSGGFVHVELEEDGGGRAAASLGGPRDGQRMAALPAAFVAQALALGHAVPRGTVTAYEALGARELVDRLVAEGFALTSTSP